MSDVHARRAVVFALEDLPAADRQHIRDIAARLHIPDEPMAWRTPLLLTNQSSSPLTPGLSDDTDVAGQGPSLLLLAMRLLLVDSYNWPERYGLTREGIMTESCALYAADPLRWTPESLAAELDGRARVPVQRGLIGEGRRPPVPGADRIPVLGWQVPTLGAPRAGAALLDLRPPELRQHHFAGQKVKMGMVPGNLTDRHRIFMRTLSAERRAQQLAAMVEVCRIDGASAERVEGQIRIEIPDLDVLCSAQGEDEAGLCALLNELLPGCLVCDPSSQLHLIDLYRLGMSARTSEAASGLGPVIVHAAVKHAPSDEGDAGLLDPALWDPISLADLLQVDDMRVSAGGRFMALRFAGSSDGVPLDLPLLLEISAAGSPSRPGSFRVLSWPADVDASSSSLALSDDERCLAARMGAGGGTLRSGTMEPGADILFFELPPPHTGDDLRPLGRAALPPPLCKRAALSLWFLPERPGLLVHDPSEQIFLTIDLDASQTGLETHARATTKDDLLALLCCQEGVPLRRLLRTLAGECRGVEDGWALGFASVLSEVRLEPREMAAALIATPHTHVARYILEEFIRAARPRTFFGTDLRNLQG